MHNTIETVMYVVRHGETDYNRDGVYQGTLDIPLNENGRWQALSLARKIASIPVHAIYSSPLIRARETTAAIVREMRRTCVYTRVKSSPPTKHLPFKKIPDVITLTELQEFSYGSWQGLTHEERQQLDPTLHHEWRTDPWNVRFPEGESLDDAMRRIMDPLDSLLIRHRGETILISGHGHVNRLILMYLCNIERNKFWDIQQPNGCCYRIVITYAGTPKQIMQDLSARSAHHSNLNDIINVTYERFV